LELQPDAIDSLRGWCLVVDSRLLVSPQSTRTTRGAKNKFDTSRTCLAPFVVGVDRQAAPKRRVL